MQRFIQDNGPEPHIIRTGKLLKAHPEVKQLFGTEPWSLAIIAFLVVSQTLLAFYLQDQAWWVVLLAAYTVGAVLSHAVFVFIHEATHNLIIKGNFANKLLGCIVNLPILFPGAIGFRKFHMAHHQYQGEIARDADLASLWEAEWVGNSTPRKIVWFLFFFAIEGIVRPARVKYVKLWDRWVVFNVLAQIAYTAFIVSIAGWVGVAYLFASFAFAIGFHPLGARWIQEHYVVKPGQETYSYYGIGNIVAFNVGYHNEHHDLMTIPWSRLPKLKAMAPEFYDTLYSHRSWSALFFRFLFDKNLTLFSRVVREDATGRRKKTAPMGVSSSDFTETLAPTP